MTKNLALALVVSCLLTMVARASNEPAPPQPLPPAGEVDVTKNAYYQLYLTRVDMAKAEVDKQKASNAYSLAKYERSRILYQRNAMSLEEYQQSQADWQVGVATYQQDIIKVAEAEAILKITIGRVRMGLEMPICTIQH